MQLHMTAPTEIGLEQAGPNGEGAMFGLKAIDKTGAVDKIAKGKMAILTEADKKDEDSGFGLGDTDEESDPEEDRLDREMDSMYDQYQTRKSEADAKFRAKKSRKEHEDGDWEGFSADNHDSDDDKLEEDSSDESDDEAPTSRSLLTKLEREDKKEGGLSRRAAQFFDQDIFKDIGAILKEEPESEVENDGETEIAEDLEKLDIIMQESILDADSDVPVTEEVDQFADSSDDEGFEVVKKTVEESQWEEEVPLKDGKLGMQFSLPPLLIT